MTNIYDAAIESPSASTLNNGDGGLSAGLTAPASTSHSGSSPELSGDCADSLCALKATKAWGRGVYQKVLIAVVVLWLAPGLRLTSNTIYGVVPLTTWNFFMFTVCLIVAVLGLSAFFAPQILRAPSAPARYGKTVPDLTPWVVHLCCVNMGFALFYLALFGSDNFSAGHDNPFWETIGEAILSFFASIFLTCLCAGTTVACASMSAKVGQTSPMEKSLTIHVKRYSWLLLSFVAFCSMALLFFETEDSIARREASGGAGHTFMDKPHCPSKSHNGFLNQETCLPHLEKLMSVGNTPVSTKHIMP